MSEQTERLRHTLHELEAELSALDTLDEETRQVLETAMDEISGALKKSESDDKRNESVVARLQDAAEGFETSHPTLFGVVQRMIDALGQMGI